MIWIHGTRPFDERPNGHWETVEELEEGEVVKYLELNEEEKTEFARDYWLMKAFIFTDRPRYVKFDEGNLEPGDRETAIYNTGVGFLLIQWVAS